MRPEQPGPYVPCPHGYRRDECAACSPSPRVGQPKSPEASERPLSWIWWTLLGGIVGAIGIKLVDRFWPQKPETIYHVPLQPGQAPPGTDPNALPADYWKTGGT